MWSVSKISPHSTNLMWFLFDEFVLRMVAHPVFWSRYILAFIQSLESCRSDNKLIFNALLALKVSLKIYSICKVYWILSKSEIIIQVKCSKKKKLERKHKNFSREMEIVLKRQGKKSYPSIYFSWSSAILKRTKYEVCERVGNEKTTTAKCWIVREVNFGFQIIIFFSLGFHIKRMRNFFVNINVYLLLSS